MAKQVASPTATADLATASEVTGGAIDIDNLQPGQAASFTDGGPVQGEANIAKEAREVVEMGYNDRNGNPAGVIQIIRY